MKSVEELVEKQKLINERNSLNKYIKEYKELDEKFINVIKKVLKKERNQ